MAAGCQSGPKTETVVGSHGRKTSSDEHPLSMADDACSERLQDVCGLLLVYESQQHHLPQTLDDLKSVPGASDVGDFVCPVSKMPYTYNRDGIPAPSGTGRIICYDSTPAHGGLRMCIEIVSREEAGLALQTKVIPLPEKFFKGK